MCLSVFTEIKGSETRRRAVAEPSTRVRLRVTEHFDSNRGEVRRFEVEREKGEAFSFTFFVSRVPQVLLLRCLCGGGCRSAGPFEVQRHPRLQSSGWIAHLHGESEAVGRDLRIGLPHP